MNLRYHIIADYFGHLHKIMNELRTNKRKNLFLKSIRGPKIELHFQVSIFVLWFLFRWRIIYFKSSTESSLGVQKTKWVNKTYKNWIIEEKNTNEDRMRELFETHSNKFVNKSRTNERKTFYSWYRLEVRELPKLSNEPRNENFCLFRFSIHYQANERIANIPHLL